jgi:hypothetical protein
MKQRTFYEWVKRLKGDQSSFWTVTAYREEIDQRNRDNRKSAFTKLRLTRASVMERSSARMAYGPNAIGKQGNYLQI